jgi:hypothetical protein
MTWRVIFARPYGKGEEATHAGAFAAAAPAEASRGFLRGMFATPGTLKVAAAKEASHLEDNAKAASKKGKKGAAPRPMNIVLVGNGRSVLKRNIGVGPHRYYPPRHPKRFEPSLLESNGIL